MKIVIIGLGSMGKRRMRLLHKIAEKEKLNIKLIATDGREDRRNEAEGLARDLGFDVVLYDCLDKAVLSNDDIDAAIISTSPLSHASIISECLKYGINVFTELNLVDDGYDENIFLAKDKGLTLFLSSTPIYRSEVKYITNVVSTFSQKLNYTYHVGQYLPDWHPWESYKDFFIGNKRTNGCREILAVELPWIVKAFGDIESVKVVSDRKTKLDIDFDDCYNIVITHKTGNTGVLIVDVVSHPAIRDLKIIGEGLYISWDGSPQGLRECYGHDDEIKHVELYSCVEHLEGYNVTIVENMYENELQDFLSVLRGDKVAEYSFEQDRIILDIIDHIEGL